jgi:hypothetical protein
MGKNHVIKIKQDGMFNATQLLKQWNDLAGTQKQMVHFTENVSTKEYIQTIESDLNSSERNSVLMQSRANKGVNAGTWMHPYLFIDFAMWWNLGGRILKVEKSHLIETVKGILNTPKVGVLKSKRGVIN